MSETNREIFIAAVRRAAHSRPVTEPTAPRLDPAIARQVRPGEDLVARFVAAVQFSGAAAQALNSADELPNVVGEICARHELKTAIAEAGDEVSPLVSAIEECGVQVVRWSAADNMETSFAVDAGLTAVRWAVAETGSLVLSASASAGRMISLAPLVHIALVRREQIVPDLLDLFGADGFDPANMPSGAVLITGPSKTADIELNLVTGVHGPGFVYAIILP
jgi:L-lactate dehydrogenase complex protein LldG